MAQQKIYELSSHSSITSTDVVPISLTASGYAEKQTISGLTTYFSANLTAIPATSISDGSISNTEFGYLNGVSSNIQTQIDSKSNTIHTHTTTDITNLSSYTGFDARYYTETETDTLLNAKQDDLVSGTNIKTVNGNSLLGSGDIVITGGGTVDSIQPGANIDVDNTDPANPIVSVENLVLADITDVTASVTEINYVDGVTSNIQDQLNALANGMIYKGNWDASAGTFPGAGSAEIGRFYTVSVGGTVDGQVFNAGDRLIAIVDNASTTIFSGNWSILDATDAVTSVFGRVGNVVAQAGDYTKSDVGLGNVDNTSDANKPVSTAQQTALDGKVDENVAITGATKTKITYDNKGLVTSGADATTADIADSSNKRYVTDAQLTVIGNTSGTNTGDISVTDSSTIDFTLTGQALTADLTDTSVTPGSYTNADITVDAKGRVTAAANGSGGGGGSQPYTALSTDTTITQGNVYGVTASTVDINLTLSDGTSAGQTLTVKKLDSTDYSVYINNANIDGETSIELTIQDESVDLYRTGTTFIIK